MTIFYLDHEGGNDSNDGMSFANRWKTTLNGATAARIAPGDEIRVMATRPKANLGNATWTNASQTVTLASAKTVTIWNGDAAFTAVDANVTGSTVGTSLKIGTARPQAAIQSAFTTGKVAYYTLPGTIDGSSYQQISFWAVSNIASAKGTEWLQLKLCSDSIGDTAVATVPVALRANVWTRVVYDTGAALSSTINSVALYTSSDPGVPIISVQNIIICKDPAASDCLTHLSCIGKDTTTHPEWYAIETIDGTTIKLGAHYNTSTTTGTALQYFGTTETVTTYARNPYVAYVRFDVTDTGDASNFIKYTGGWNRTDMSTQTDETWISGGDYVNDYMFNLNNLDGIWIENISACHGITSGGYYSGGSAYPSAGMVVRNMNIIGFIGIGALCSPAQSDGDWEFGSIVGCDTFGIQSDSYGYNSRIKFKVIANLTSGSSNAINTFARGPAPFICGEIKNVVTGVLLKTGEFNNEAIFRGLNVHDLRGSTLASANGSYHHQYRFIDITYDGSIASSLAGTPSDTVSTMRFQGINGDPNDIYIHHNEWNGGSEQTIRHTAAGIAWRLSPRSNIRSSKGSRPMLRLATFAVQSGTLVTVKCWVYRDNSSLTAGIQIPDWCIAGLDSGVLSAEVSATSSWEELTLTFTPTAIGTVVLDGYAYGGTTYNAYFDDLTITQA